MVAIRVNAVVTEDGQLIKGVPAGKVEIVIHAPDRINAARDAQFVQPLNKFVWLARCRPALRR